MKNTALQGNRATIKVLAMLFIIPLFLAVISAQIYTVANDNGWNAESGGANNLQGDLFLTNSYPTFIQNFTIGNIGGGANPTNAYVVKGMSGYPCDFSTLDVLANVTIVYNGSAGIVTFPEIAVPPNTYIALIYDSLDSNVFTEGYQVVTNPIGNAPDMQTVARALCGLNQTTTIGLVTTIGETNATLFPPDTSPPNITLISPINNANISNTTNNVTLREQSFDDNNMSNVSFYTNVSGNFALNFTIFNATNNSIYSLTLNNLDNGSYIWSVQACDGSNNCNFSMNRTFNIAFIPPPPTVYSRGIFYVDFSQGINQILVIIAIAFAIFLFIVNQRIIASVLVEAIGFIFLFNQLNIILSLVFVLGGIIILFLQENDALRK